MQLSLHRQPAPFFRRRSRSWSRGLRLAGTVLGALLLGLLPGTTSADDTDLVRENTAKPFVFFLVDTSSSMNLDIATGSPVELDGDDPRSRIYQVKKTLYEVLEDEINVNYGFATYNQDNLHIRAKHWLYEATTDVIWPLGVNRELVYPRGTIREVGDEDDDGEIGEITTRGDWMVFGRRFFAIDPDTSALVDETALVPGGTCTAPITNRRQLNRFSKLGQPGDEAQTEMWFEVNNRVFQLLVRPVRGTTDGDGDGILDATTPVGSANLEVILELNEAINGDCSTVPVAVGVPQRVTLRLLGDFLMHDKPAGGNNAEATAGEWHWTDAFADGVNGTSTPFSGKGIEGNYDGPISSGISGDSDLQLPLGSDFIDDFCIDENNNNAKGCVDPRLKFASIESLSAPNDRELDRGDFLPWDWNGDNRNDFLKRLNPNHGSSLPADFGAAGYFANHTLPLDGPGNQTLEALPIRFTQDVNGDRIPRTIPPIVAFGQSPLARAINDFRCWYNGKDNDNKCRDDGERPWDEGWRFIAADRDALATCRRPFLIVISDGEDTSPSGRTGENASADVGNLLTKSGEPGVQTWVFNLGSLNNCSGNGELNSIANAGKTDPKTENCITVNSPTSLENKLREVLGVIVEETRSFASAAVPTVQADEGDKLFLTQFRPARGRSIWRGRILGFLKPVPLSDPPERQPLTQPVCDDLPADERSGCFLWDAAEVLLTQVDPTAPVGPDPTQRRVYHARLTDDAGDPVESGQWGGNRAPFDDPQRGATINTDPPSEREEDLWRGLGIPFDPNDPNSFALARQETRTVIDNTYAVKQHTFGTDATPTDYILGDVFHSNPLVVGAPANTRFFAQNEAGYRDFARQHQNRRSVLLMGSNDGMLHAFDAGIFDPNAGEFTDGTGKEIFAYVPRGVMPEVRAMSNFNSPRLWGVDGTVNAADVFIDPVYSGAPDPDDREWRTVLIGGLRRGGESYYALDITQPDSLREVDGDFEPANSNNPEIPDCREPTGAGSDNDDPETCHGELGYPAPLWEFDDTVLLADGTRARLDEDANGEFDLAPTWSIPNLGRIKVRRVSGLGVEEVVDKYVAVFGGGLDPSNKLGRGNFLYMVDTETGEAIYKVPLEGAATAEPAAVDTNQDGDIDRIYIGTLAGFLYRVDLVGPNGELPVLQDVTVQGVPQQRIVPLVGDPWEPTKIFDTVETVTFTDADGNEQSFQISRPIYFRPSVIFVAELGEFALAFGTGNRENLWGGSDTLEGRFYIFVDETGGPNPPTLPITQEALFPIVADDPSPDPSDPNDPINNNPRSQNPLLVPGSEGVRGWFFRLQPKERVVTNAFALSGITVFSSFIPRVDPAIGQDGEPACALRGISRAFAVFTTNGAGTLFDDSGTRVRTTEISSLATEAFIERGQTKNPAQDGQSSSDALTAKLQQVMDELKRLFPENCKFANYRLDIKTISANTGVVHIAPVPVCIIEKNWREF